MPAPDWKDFWPIFFQVSSSLLPLVPIVLSGVVVWLARLYNARVKDTRIRAAVADMVKWAEQTLPGPGTGPLKQTRVSQAIHARFPALSTDEINHLLEATVFDLHQSLKQAELLMPATLPAPANSSGGNGAINRTTTAAMLPPPQPVEPVVTIRQEPSSAATAIVASTTHVTSPHSQQTEGMPLAAPVAAPSVIVPPDTVPATTPVSATLTPDTWVPQIATALEAVAAALAQINMTTAQANLIGADNRAPASTSILPPATPVAGVLPTHQQSVAGEAIHRELQATMSPLLPGSDVEPLLAATRPIPLVDAPAHSAIALPPLHITEIPAGNTPQGANAGNGTGNGGSMQEIHIAGTGGSMQENHIADTGGSMLSAPGASHGPIVPAGMTASAAGVIRGPAAPVMHNMAAPQNSQPATHPLGTVPGPWASRRPATNAIPVAR